MCKCVINWMMNIISILIVDDILYVSLETNYIKTVYVNTIFDLSLKPIRGEHT